MIQGECYMTVDCKNKGEIICGAGSYCCDHYCIPVHNKCVRDS